MDPSSPLSPQFHADLVVSVRDIRYTQLVSFVTATIVIYDYIVCIEREVELIWKKRWSVIKFAFLWHRYFGLLCVILQVYGQHRIDVPYSPLWACSFWFYWETWGYCAVLFTSEAVLLLWIHVVYNKNRVILLVMSAFYAVEVASVLTILTFSFENFEAHVSGFLGDVEYCIMEQPPKIFQMLWIPILAYDTLLLLLFLWRGCRPTLCCSRKFSDHDSLLDMVYRHSLLNFLAIFGTYLSCAAIWLSSSISLYQIPVSFALALSITNCTRLLLNIRRAYYTGTSDSLLFNIRDIPATGANTPNMLDVPVPLPPLYDSCSQSTLRELCASPSSTLRPAPGQGHAGIVKARPDRGAPSPIRISIATTSSEVLRQVASRGASAAGKEDEDPRAVYVTPDLDAEMWQYELREMRADPEIAVAVGEAL
ncbi:hypothetical protein C8Q73DRAFT_644908 [Cubamyces lactineus]|nr:hypothetical protein C8Q73DRAFT_644908 [Cubamyces lactineus]